MLHKPSILCTKTYNFSSFLSHSEKRTVALTMRNIHVLFKYNKWMNATMKWNHWMCDRRRDIAKIHGLCNNRMSTPERKFFLSQLQLKLCEKKIDFFANKLVFCFHFAWIWNVQNHLNIECYLSSNIRQLSSFKHKWKRLWLANQPN